MSQDIPNWLKIMNDVEERINARLDELDKERKANPKK